MKGDNLYTYARMRKWLLNRGYVEINGGKGSHTKFKKPGYKDRVLTNKLKPVIGQKMCRAIIREEREHGLNTKMDFIQMKG